MLVAKNVQLDKALMDPTKLAPLASATLVNADAFVISILTEPDDPAPQLKIVVEDGAIRVPDRAAAFDDPPTTRCWNGGHSDGIDPVR